jgi:hypothetical protein
LIARMSGMVSLILGQMYGYKWLKKAEILCIDALQRGWQPGLATVIALKGVAWMRSDSHDFAFHFPTSDYSSWPISGLRRSTSFLRISSRYSALIKPSCSMDFTRIMIRR